MAESRYVPNDLMSSEGVYNLLPSQKLIIYWMWSNIATTSTGCYVFSTARAEKSLRIEQNAVADALREFERRGLIASDEGSREIFVNGWFKVHRIETEKQKLCFVNDLKKIRSARLKGLVEKAANDSSGPKQAARIIPTNLMAFPGLSNLLPDQKLLIYWLWSNQSATTVGCYLLPTADAAADLQLGQESIEEAILEFGRRGLVALDLKTGEIFVKAWFRFHRFDSAARKFMLQNDFESIVSNKLRRIVMKSCPYILREEKLREVKLREEKDQGNEPSFFSEKTENLKQVSLAAKGEGQEDTLIAVVQSWGIIVPASGDKVMDNLRARKIVEKGEVAANDALKQTKAAGRIGMLSEVYKLIAAKNARVLADDGRAAAEREIERSKEIIRKYSSTGSELTQGALPLGVILSVINS